MRRRLSGLVLLLSASCALAANIPPQALQYFPVLKWEAERTLKGAIAPPVLASQIEQETCSSLRSPSCWSPRARRFVRGSEEGIGLGQVTRTWRANGSVRFDTLAELRGLDPYLAAWNWTDPYNPKYQLRGLALMDRKCWFIAAGAAAEARTAMALACYNGGGGALQADRKICAAAPGCNKNLWWGNVESRSVKSRTRRKKNQESDYEINRGYVRNILTIRLLKYSSFDWSKVAEPDGL